MSRAKRSMKRRQFRFSLDPMDPVEGEALRQIDEIADQAKEMFESISQDEADRYAFKRILLGLLKDRPVELTAPARSAPVAIAPASISAPAAVASTPAAPQPEAARTPVEQPPKAQEVPVETVGKEGTEEEGQSTEVKRRLPPLKRVFHQSHPGTSNCSTARQESLLHLSTILSGRVTVLRSS